MACRFSVSDLSPPVSGVGAIKGDGKDFEGLSGALKGSRKDPFSRDLYRCFLCGGKKRGPKVGKTKCGKGTKVMAIVDNRSLPIALSVESAAPHESRLVEGTLRERYTQDFPHRLIGDKAYDSDVLDAQLARRYRIALIAPHKSNRVKPPTQDGRALRRYKRRWKIERFFAWLQRFRRVETRYEYKAENFLGMVQLASIIIMLRYL